MLLNDLNVDRIEVASARVSEGEKEAVGMICRYAAKIDKADRVEVLGFVDGGKSVDWVVSCGERPSTCWRKVLCAIASYSCRRNPRSISTIFVVR